MYSFVILLVFLCIGGSYAHGSTHFDMNKLPNYLQSGMLDAVKESLKESLHSDDVQILSVKRLSDSHKRNLIVRLKVLLTSTKKRLNIILKQSQEGDDDHQKDIFARFARDWAGLAFMNSKGTKEETEKHMPAFYGANVNFKYILMEDLSTDCKDFSVILTSDHHSKIRLLKAIIDA